MKSKLCPRDGELHYRYEAGAKFSEQKHPTLLSLSGVFSSQVIIWRGDISTLSHQQPTRGDPGGRNYHNTYNAIFQDIFKVNNNILLAQCDLRCVRESLQFIFPSREMLHLTDHQLIYRCIRYI